LNYLKKKLGTKGKSFAPGSKEAFPEDFVFR